MNDISDSEILPLSLEHTFWTWSAQGKVAPIPVKRAKGVYFWDVNDKRYLDFNSMVMCVNIGHGDERVIEAIVKQARELPFAGPPMATKPRAILGKLLTEITPGDMDHFLFTLGGAEANENAIKLARAFTGKHKILSRYRSYHGASAGAMAATGDPRRVAWEPNTMPGVVHFLDPYRYRSTFHRTNTEISEPDFALDYLNHLEEIIRYEGAETIAGVLIESVTGTNGVIIPPEGYLQGVRTLCDKYGILMIADEVMSGFGRTGKWFAVDHWGVVPDLMTMAKGLTSAYAPLGAVGMRPEIANFFKDRVYQGGLTYNSHPISLAAAIANIQVMQEDHLVEHAASMGAVLHRMLTDLGENHLSVGEVRSIGLFGILELVRDRQTREPLAPFNDSSPEMNALRKYMLDNGVYIYTHWHTVLIIPPLIINEQQLAEGFEVLDRALSLTDQTLKNWSVPEIPALFLKQMQDLLGSEYQDFQAIYLRPASSGIRANTLKISAENLVARLPFALQPLPWTESGFELVGGQEKEQLSPGSLPEHAAGLYYVQEPSTMLAAELLDPKPDERVLDLCAAPGGKSTHLASRMQNEGLLLVNEIHPKRVWEATQNLERWGARNAIIANENPARLAEYLPEYFDKILVDAPCSGEGMFRKSESARRDWSPELVQSCAARQGVILRSATAMLKPGGLLAYTTCTFNPHENESVISRLLKACPELEIVSRPLSGIDHGRPERLSPEHARAELRDTLRHWPHQSPGEGHFLALLTKKGFPEGPRSGKIGKAPSSRKLRHPIGKEAHREIVRFVEGSLMPEAARWIVEGDRLLQVGSYIYRGLPDCPNLRGLKIIHPGWWLGTLQTSKSSASMRFNPSHAMAMGLSRGTALREIRLNGGDPKISAYLRGEMLQEAEMRRQKEQLKQGELLHQDQGDGWGLIKLDGFALGWGKISGGRVKNAYPRGLRRF